MMDIYEYRKIRLTVKSPVHIGSVNQNISKFEYMHSGEYIFPVSEDKLALFLQKKNLIDPYMSEVSREGRNFNLMNFFNDNAGRLTDDELICLSGKRKIRLKGDINRLVDFKPFIRDGFNNIYIPGTSIKGAIRTAILYRVLKEFKKTDPRGFQKTVEDKLAQDITNDFKKRNRKRLFQWGNER